MNNVLQKAEPTYDNELKAWTILFPIDGKMIPLGETVSVVGATSVFEYSKFDTARKAQKWIEEHYDRFYYEIPVRFFEFNDFSYYALIAVENNCKEPMDTAIAEYKSKVADIEDEDKYKPKELTIDEAMEQYKHGVIESCSTEEEKIKDFFEKIDFNQYTSIKINETHKVVLLIDRDLC